MPKNRDYVDNKEVKIATIQLACAASKQDNIEKTIGKIREVAAKGAQIICLQELFASLYFCDKEDYANFSLAEPIPGETTKIFSVLAKELEVVIVASLFEKRTDGIYHNTIALFDTDGSMPGIYRKMHIPDDPGYYEKFYFTPGDLGYKVFNTKYGRVGTLICWDQWYPEAARITCLMGAQILVYPTAIGWAEQQTAKVNIQQYDAWQTIQRGHAIANGVYVVAVNRTGKEAAMNFWGGSFIAGPFGQLLYQAPHDKEEVHVHTLDLAQIDYYRVHWPFFRDRRIDSYRQINERFVDQEKNANE